VKAPVPRKRRTDAPRTIHHVWARGVLRRPVFIDDVDRFEMRERLGLVFVECEAAALAWAFLTNHIHLVVRTGGVSISKVMGLVLSEYASAFNRRHERSGHVFQGRFGSRPILDDSDFIGILRYVHRNPIEAGLANDTDSLASYRWCGHSALIGLRSPLPFEDPAAAIERFGPDSACARNRIVEWMNSTPPAATDLFARLLVRVCRDEGVTERDLLSGARDQAASRVRTTLCVRGVRDLGLSKAEVARRLRVTKMAVTHALRRSSE
jgi:REP element-mobilizing transposase RayT